MTERAIPDSPMLADARAKPARRLAVWNTRWLGVAFIAVLLALWELAAASGAMPSLSFPRMSEILAAWWNLVLSGELLRQLGDSLWRMFAGYFIGVSLGVLIGLMMGYFRVFYNLLEPITEVLRPIPSARRCSFCVRQWTRSSLMTEAGSVMVRRPCLVFGALKRKPACVCSSDCSTRRARLSRSMLLQRNAQSSPRLRPLPNATMAIVQSSALRSRKLASIASTSFSRRISISACCTRGGCTRVAGFCVISPHCAA